MNAAGTLPFLRGQKSAKIPLDTARLLKISIENTKLLHCSPVKKKNMHKICIF